MIVPSILRLPQPLLITSQPTFAGLGLTGLTASRLVATDANKSLSSASLASWVAGTANRVTVADNGAGGATLSAPQDMHTAATPTYAGLMISGNSAGQTLTVAGGVSILRLGGVALTVRQDAISSGNDTLYVQHDSTSTGRYIIRAQNNAGVTPADVFTVEASGRIVISNTLGIGGASPTSGTGVCAIKAGTAPSLTIVDTAIIYAADIAPGQAAVHILNESGSVIKLYRQGFVASPTADAAALKIAVDAIRTILINSGQMAAS